MDKEKDVFNSGDILSFIIRKRKPVVLVLISALIISTIVSFLIEPKYKSSVIIFPSPAYSISNSYLNINTYKPSSAQFGEEEESERLLQVLKSELFRNQVIKKFNLKEHYGIKKENINELPDLFEKNFTFRRTKYMGIEIRVFDKNPEKSAKMANYSSELLDSLMNNIFQERAKKAFNIVKSEYLDTEKQISLIRDTMAAIADKGILDFERQTESYTEAYVNALNSRNKRAINIIENKMKILEKYGSAYLSYKKLLEEENERLSMLKAKYSEAKVDANESIPYKYVVDSAHIPNDNSYPVKWAIVLISLISSFIMSVIVLIIIEKFKSIS